MSPTPAARPVTSLESPPGKAGFRVSELLLLGGFPPLFDQLQQRLTAAAQTLAFLELVNHGHGFAGQGGDELLHAMGREPPPVGAIFVETGICGCLHAVPLVASNHNTLNLGVVYVTAN